MIKKAEVRTFYHGSHLPRTLGILESGSINCLNSQGKNTRSVQNVSLQRNAVYVTTDKELAKAYVLNYNSSKYGIFLR